MAIYYVDLENGNDSTGSGTYSAPYKTHNKAMEVSANNDEIRIAKNTTPDTTITTSVIWTRNSTSVVMDGNHTATMVAGSYIGKPTAAGNGAFETFYRVTSSSYSAGTGKTTVILTLKYIGQTETVSSLIKKYIAKDTGHDSSYTTSTVSAYKSSTYRTGMKLSGGWNLSTQTRDGETWCCGNPQDLTTNWNFYYTPGGGNNNFTIEYMNVVETYNCINGFASNALITLQYLTTFGGDAAWSGNVLNMENSNHVSYSCTNSSGTITQTNIGGARVLNYVQTNCHGQHWFDYGATSYTFNNCVIASDVYNAGCYYTYSNNKPVYINNTVFLGTKSQLTRGIVSDAVFTPLIFTGDSWVESCDIGINLSNSTSSGSTVDNPKTINCTYGINVGTQKFGLNIYNFYADSCDYCLYSYDQYNRNINVDGFYFTNVGVWGFYVLEPWTTYDLRGYIDSSSASKLMYNNYPTKYSPRYVASGTPNIVPGIYFGTYRFKFYNNVYRTTAPSYWFSTDVNMSDNLASSRLFSGFVEAGKKYKVSVWIKTGGPSWLGTVIFRLLVNEERVLTNTYTTLPDYWTKYEFTMPSTATADGEIALEVNINQNIVDLFFDDFDMIVV